MMVSYICLKESGVCNTYNLELDRHKSEVDDLDCRPDQIVRFEGGNVDLLELPRDSALTATLCNRHEGEEDTET
jgi:hypothetical protein